MIIIYIAVAVLVSILIVCLVSNLIDLIAVDGWEDADGFHYGVQPPDKPEN